jgi:hypothetical protein
MPEGLPGLSPLTGIYAGWSGFFGDEPSQSQLTRERLAAEYQKFVRENWDMLLARKAAGDALRGNEPRDLYGARFGGTRMAIAPPSTPPSSPPPAPGGSPGPPPTSGGGRVVEGAFGRGELPINTAGRILTERLPAVIRPFAKLYNAILGSKFAALISAAVLWDFGTAIWEWASAEDPQARKVAEREAKAMKRVLDKWLKDLEKKELEAEKAADKAAREQEKREANIRKVEGSSEDIYNRVEGIIRGARERGENIDAAKRAARDRAISDAKIEAAERATRAQQARIAKITGALGLGIQLGVGLFTASRYGRGPGVTVFPPRDFPTPEPIGGPALGFTEGLTGLDPGLLTSEQLDPDLVCYRKSERRKRRKPKGKRICYTRSG